jgi:hypothetical protein
MMQLIKRLFNFAGAILDVYVKGTKNAAIDRM